MVLQPIAYIVLAMPVKREITIYDIAERLGLSASTVSRGLRNHPAIRKETIDRIQKMAAKMNYQQNTFASNLRSNRSNTIGVILPLFESSFMSAVVSSMERVIRSKGYNLLVSQSFDSNDIQRENLETHFNNRVDGLLLNLTPETEQMDDINMFVNKEIPVVLFDRVLRHSCDICTTVTIDNRKAGYDVTRHLISQGCKRIVYLGENTTCMVFGERYRGYMDALLESGMEVDPDLVISGHLNTKTGARVVKQILKMKNRPDGIFAGNDMSAVSLMIELKKAGVSIPRDIAIAGFNNIYISGVVQPALTTVNYPSIEMGRIAAAILMEMLESEQQVKPQNIILDHELVVRESSMRNS